MHQRTGHISALEREQVQEHSRALALHLFAAPVHRTKMLHGQQECLNWSLWRADQTLPEGRDIPNSDSPGLWVSMSHLPFSRPRLRIPGGCAQCGPQPPSRVCTSSYPCAPHGTCGEQMHTRGSTHSGAHCSPDDPTHTYTCTHSLPLPHACTTVPSSLGPQPLLWLQGSSPPLWFLHFWGASLHIRVGVPAVCRAG